MPVVATGNTLLTYALIPNPDPLQVNGPGILILTVSNSTDRLITASEIVVTVPGGVNAKDLTTQAGTIETQPLDGWTVSNGAGAITLTPSAPAHIGRDGVVFVFDNFAVNGEPGTTTLTIVETASSSDMPAAPRTASLALAKFPAQFSLSDLTTNDLDVPYGGSATLTWAGTAGATYTLEYQPADSGPPVNAPVGNAGTYTADQLTRSDSVTFTLTASVTVPGQDQPLIAQRQHTVTIETVTLSTTFEPPTVGMGGLVRFTWDAPNADGCTLEDGTQLPASGTCYLVMQSTRQFTVTAMVGGNAVKQLQSTIKVDPAIVPTEAGVAVTAGDGSPGDVWTCVAPGTGGPATCTGAMAPLDLAVPPARVIPITLVGGHGGFVHHAGKLRPPCRYRGGAGGDAVIDITLDAAGAPAQYVIAMRPGAGGQGVLGPGASGAIAITIDGQPGTISPPQLASGRKTKKESGMTIGATGETLLTYAMSTDPDPLQVGGPGILTLAVSNSTNALITCNQIVVVFPGGVNAKDLTTDAGSIETQHADAWRASNTAGQITLTPTDGGQIGRDGVVFVFDNFAVNSEPGIATMTISEVASSPAQPAATRTGAIAVPKFPTQFSLSDLTCADDDVPYGGAATLAWTGTSGPTYGLEYQPADSGTPVTAPVGNVGPYTANNLTRAGSVTFTLTASVTVPGQDAPLIAQRQHTVTIETVTLSTTFEPPAVGIGGLVRFTWDAPNADDCTLEDGTQLPASGTRYFVMQSTRQFTVTAFVQGVAVRQQQSTVTVDATIRPTEAGVTINGGGGSQGDGYACVPPGSGQSAVLNGPMAPLDETARPARVIPITLNGGAGGSVPSEGKLAPNCIFVGGPGGNAVLNITLDAAGAPAQYVIRMNPGPGGQGNSGNGGSGGVSMTVDGQPTTMSP